MGTTRRATFTMVAAGDGAPRSPSGYDYYLLVHTIATVLLLVTLVAGIWQFMDWVAAPSCPGPVRLSSVTSPAAEAPAGTAAPAASGSVQAALRSGECPCPDQR